MRSQETDTRRDALRSWRPRHSCRSPHTHTLTSGHSCVSVCVCVHEVSHSNDPRIKCTKVAQFGAGVRFPIDMGCALQAHKNQSARSLVRQSTLWCLVRDVKCTRRTMRTPVMFCAEGEREIFVLKLYYSIVYVYTLHAQRHSMLRVVFDRYVSSTRARDGVLAKRKCKCARQQCTIPPGEGDRKIAKESVRNVRRPFRLPHSRFVYTAQQPRVAANGSLRRQIKRRIFCVYLWMFV